MYEFAEGLQVNFADRLHVDELSCLQRFCSWGLHLDEPIVEWWQIVPRSVSNDESCVRLLDELRVKGLLKWVRVESDGKDAGLCLLEGSRRSLSFSSAQTAALRRLRKAGAVIRHEDLETSKEQCWSLTFAGQALIEQLLRQEVLRRCTISEFLHREFLFID